MLVPVTALGHQHLMLSSPHSSRSTRLPVIDAARGVAILAMVAYHLSWDLDFLGFFRLDLLTNPFWLAARTAILSTFLLLVGVSLVLAVDRGFDRRRCRRRLGVLVVAAAAVSAVSYAQFPDSPIFFGVLHHIAVASLLGLAFVRLPWGMTLALGLLACVLPSIASAPLFDDPWLRWVGLMTFEPDSNDYIPLFPWFGVVLWGIVLGRLWRRHPTRWEPTNKTTWALVKAGRFSLPIYLLHQPLLFGALSLALLLGAGRDSDPETRSFLTSCETGCMGAGESTCTTRCRCIADTLKRDNLWRNMLENHYDSGARATIAAVVLECRR